MPINLDTRAAIRHPDLVRVVHAVVDADEHDEADWIEWKSDLDLSTKRGCFSVARTILGMANRAPASASLACEGLGYIVVGAEPGGLRGVTSVDPADLDQTLGPWLGGVEGPRYSPTYVYVDGMKVLVVVVEAPKNGDPIYSLRREFDGIRDGEVFVRKMGRTERANSLDLRALVERARAPAAVLPGLEVSLVGDVPLSWFDRTTIDSVVTEWAGDRQRAMESKARAEERRRRPETIPVPNHRTVDATASIMADYVRQQEELARKVLEATRMASIPGLANEPDKRTLEDFLAEVQSWGERAVDAGPAVLMDRYLRAGHGLVAVQVHNPSGRYLPKVKVEVNFEWDLVSSPERDRSPKRLPRELHPYGKPYPSPLAQAFSAPPRLFPSVVAPVGRMPIPPRSWTEKGSVRIVFDVGDLRQEATDTSEMHYLLLPELPPDGTLRGTWKATVPEVHGVIRGTLAVPVREDPVSLRELLDRDPVTDEDE